MYFRTTVTVGPRKYDARPVAPVPVSHRMGDEDSAVYVVDSEIGSTSKSTNYWCEKI